MNTVNLNSFELISKGSQSSVDRKSNRIIRTQQEFNEFKTKNPEIEFNVIDFSKDMIITVYKGRCSSGGHAISIESIEPLEHKIEINVILESPGNNCRVTMALTYPYAIYKVPTTDKEPLFIYKKEIKPCR
ncbi:MAG: protease complex subunit PrcB family protein [Salinivirgaceae bacterium]|nr:protease complex subunit PrcB family protein [Salinivirgaceae bacterium]MDD4745726.1 protease complex subunit PrcB family protein [Salinivirgaceae bacterium]